MDAPESAPADTLALPDAPPAITLGQALPFALAFEARRRQAADRRAARTFPRIELAGTEPEQPLRTEKGVEKDLRGGAAPARGERSDDMWMDLARSREALGKAYRSSMSRTIRWTTPCGIAVLLSCCAFPGSRRCSCCSSCAP